jgi:hypothetical protein
MMEKVKTPMSEGSGDTRRAGAPSPASSPDLIPSLPYCPFTSSPFNIFTLSKKQSDKKKEMK